MRIVYLVVSHRNAEQVLRLVRALGEGRHGEVVVRHDQRREALGAGALGEAGGRLLEDGIEVEWGRHSHLRMLLGALGRIRQERDPDWVMVLSGQDYPLRPLAEVERRLAESSDDAYLGVLWRLELDAARRPPEQEEFFRRYAYRHFSIPSSAPHPPARLGALAYRRDLPDGAALLGVRRARLPFGPGRECWVSSDWPLLGRRALAALTDAGRRDSALMRHYRHSFAASESFIATVLKSDRGLRVSGDDRRFVPFQPGAPNPDTLTSADLDRLIASGAHFARKFDARVDAAVLDALDARRNAATPG